MPYFDVEYGNPSSHYYGLGHRAAEAVQNARAQVAELIGAAPEEIIFTSGGTESNNLAIKGMLAAAEKGKDHVVTSNVEHYSVLYSLRALQGRGYTVTYLPVDNDGLPGHKSGMRDDAVDHFGHIFRCGDPAQRRALSQSLDVVLVTGHPASLHDAGCDAVYPGFGCHYPGQ